MEETQGLAGKEMQICFCAAPGIHSNPTRLVIVVGVQSHQFGETDQVSACCACVPDAGKKDLAVEFHLGQSYGYVLESLVRNP